MATHAKSARRKPRPDDEEAALAAMEIELQRRLPEPYTPAQVAKSEGQLDGLLIYVNHSHDYEMRTKALAAMNLRRQMNRHGCTRVRPEDPPCQHPDHWKDVAELRYLLMVAGLPGDMEALGDC